MKTTTSASEFLMKLQSAAMAAKGRISGLYADVKSGQTDFRSVRKRCSLVGMGIKALRKVDTDSSQAVILQYRTLLELIKENKDTEYGKRYHFAEIHSLDDFRSHVPFSTYEDYEPYIRRMIKGEERLLSVRPPLHYALTSGTMGDVKQIPVSQREMLKYAWYTGAMAFGVANEYYFNTTRRGAPVGPGLNAIEMKVVTNEAGVNQGSIFGTLKDSMKDFIPFLMSAPWEIISPSGEVDMKYLKTRLALADRNLVFMESVFMTGLVDLMDYIRENYKMLCRDIFYGQINEDVQVPAEIREALSGRLVPDKTRAMELMREFQEGFDTPIIPRIWPKMSWIGGIGTGSFTSYAKKMRKYAGKSIPFNNLCYSASECFIAAARHMGDESYVLIPDGGFYEFIPTHGDTSRTLTIEELEVGDTYEIVVTNLSGFYRYRLGDVVRVTGYYNETPMLRFIYRASQLISIIGEDTDEEGLQWAVSEFGRITGINVLDYSVYADTKSDPARYIILMEPERPVEEEEISWCREVMEQKLMHTNPRYGDRIRSGELKPLEIVFLQSQTYQLYRDMQIMRGRSSNQLKPVRVINTPEKKSFFFGLMENGSIRLPHEKTQEK